MHMYDTTFRLPYRTRAGWLALIDNVRIFVCKCVTTTQSHACPKLTIQALMYHMTNEIAEGSRLQARRFLQLDPFRIAPAFFGTSCSHFVWDGFCSTVRVILIEDGRPHPRDNGDCYWYSFFSKTLLLFGGKRVRSKGTTRKTSEVPGNRRSICF